MVRRRKTKRKVKKTSFKLGSLKSKQKRTASPGPSLMGILQIMAVICVFIAVVAGFMFLEKYVKEEVPVSEKTGTLVLVDVPVWVNEQLKEKIYTAATAGGEDLKLDEDAARSVQQNIESLVAWVNGVQVQVTGSNIRIKASWRKPIAMVKSGFHKFYVDSNLAVLDFVPMEKLPIVQVKGLSAISRLPTVGLYWDKEDLAAAVAVLTQLDRMDKLTTPDKPLLYEIESIDVSNFNGRENSRFPHIVLYAKDKTEIIWGAEIGNWARHFEAKDEEKLAKLYSYYKEHGSLLEGVKYINLRDPQDEIPLPIDRY